jgi:threonine dehydrogenase-like Zn-dependent dehydrogenase
MARLKGASTIFLADRVPHRLALGASIDPAIVTVNMREASIIEAVADITRGRGVDVVFDAAAGRETRDAGIHIARSGAQYVLIGIPGEADTVFDLQTAMSKEIRIQTIKRSNHQGHGALHLIESGKIPTSIITHRVPMERTAEAFELVSDYRDGVGKLIIEMGRS